MIAGVGIPQVEIDNEAAVAQAVAHLVALGHRHLAYIGGPEGNSLEAKRWAGFVAGLQAADCAMMPPLRLPGDFTFRSGVRAAERFLDLASRPTGVFAANDEMAIGFMHTLRQRGLKVPEDVSIVGFDGIEFADFCEPALTTLRQPRRAIGATAASLLLECLEGHHSAKPVIRQLTAEFLIRGSTGPVRRGK